MESGDATYILPRRALAFCSSSRFLVGVGGAIPSLRQPAASFKLPRYEPPSRLCKRRANSLGEGCTEKVSGRPLFPTPLAPPQPQATWKIHGLGFSPSTSVRAPGDQRLPSSRSREPRAAAFPGNQDVLGGMSCLPISQTSDRMKIVEVIYLQVRAPEVRLIMAILTKQAVRKESRRQEYQSK